MTLPTAGDPDKRAVGLDRWRAAGGSQQAQHIPILSAVFGNSPYLSRCALSDVGFMGEILEHGPQQAWHNARDGLFSRLSPLTPEATLMKALRLGKRQMALATAIADLTGAWPLETITATLSDYAERAVAATVAVLLRAGHEAEQITLPHPQQPLKECRYTVFAMGKLGARELNYSSDIDLIVLYDPERMVYRGSKSLADFCVRLTKNMVRILEERTADGYVFRTDLRLRPDPGSTAVAIGVHAALAYYESLGQNWERAAMIKVRPIAGDMALGAWFQHEMRPFVWRRSLDFYAIRDIHSIKRQINATKGGDAVLVAGHNIKLGRGGIREIEFYVQTQQLIFGGREVALRCPATLAALAALADSGRVSMIARDSLTTCYEYLRTLEHRLQMTDDQQTQTLPRDPAGLAALAGFMGFDDTEAFLSHTRRTLRCVQNHYAALFEDEDSLSDPGTLVFTGTDDDPGTLATLADLGFENALAVSATVRGWHHGRYRSLRTTRARELLTELTPALLAALGRSRDPDRAFARFDDLLARLPIGVQIFALFTNNPSLLDLLSEILGDAPRLATLLSQRPGTFEAVLTPGFFEPPAMGVEGRRLMAHDLATWLGGSRHYEETLDMVRQWANARHFQIGVQTLQGLLSAQDGGVALAAVADTAVGAVMTATEGEFTERHGHVEGGGMAILAFGSLAAEEMIAASDLDLVMVYEAGAEASNGPKPLAASEWYGKLTQRLVSGITALTREGRLYEVDLRLRPEGSKGPLAIALSGFSAYYEGAAWTWEYLALVRSRVIAGPAGLVARLEAVIVNALAQPHDRDQRLMDIAAMRRLMARERPDSGPFDVKLRRGGLVDIEFIVGVLILDHMHTHPALRTANTQQAISTLAERDLLTPEQAVTLHEAHGLWLEIRSVLRHLMDEPLNPATAPDGIVRRLAQATGEPDLPRLMARMDDTARAVHELYDRLIDQPVLALKSSQETPP